MTISKIKVLPVRAWVSPISRPLKLRANFLAALRNCLFDESGHSLRDELIKASYEKGPY